MAILATRKARQFAKLKPLTAIERREIARSRFGHAIGQLRLALDFEPASVRTYAYAAVSRWTEYVQTTDTIPPSDDPTV